jgi:glutathione synthase/RimK-type ligase-like ATP-grasp enzyme
VTWDDTDARWDAYAAVLIRSTWDYHHRLDDFVAWCEQVAAVSRLWNPLPVVRWNAHKGYLLGLADAGVPTVPTVVVEAGDCGADVQSLLTQHGWDEAVVKPAVSAGGKATSRVRGDDPTARARFADAVMLGDTLVQPYLDAIRTDGEMSTIVIDGGVSHGIEKLPGDTDFRVQVQFGGRERLVEPSAAEVGLAQMAVEAARSIVGHDLLYARVDSVTVDGQPLLMELEVIEPSLFFDHVPSAAAGLIAALQRRL